MPQRRIHYVLSTHWDREWYQPFQEYRYRLVQLIDRVLDGMADGRLEGAFHTDGHSIILEDYLEIRPERRPQVLELLRQRKIMTGPWYVLPDEFIVSGESIVRNLRLGRDVARSMGAQPSNAGFVCDMFGHVSQLPQIFAGFGIRGAFIWRGVNAVESRHVMWRGADGTELACYRFGHAGYCSFAFAVRHSQEPGHVFDPARARADLEKFIDFEAARTPVEPILLFDGGDHLEWDPSYYDVVMKRGDVVHSSLDDYLAEMLPQAGRITARVEGELREPALYPTDVDQQYLIPGVASSRVWIKQANAACQSLLCQWAEPMSAFAPEPETRQGFLDAAWKWLLTNHPHDSICGCGVDAVHEDMKYRFSQCRQIADRLTIETTRRVAASIEGEVGEKELRVVVFNPLPRESDEIVDLTLQIPAEWPAFQEFFGFEPKPAFRIFGAQGREIPYQRLSQKMNRKKFRIFDRKFPQSYSTHDVRVAVRLPIPALGYTTLAVRAEDKATRHPETPGLAVDDRSMANERVSVRVEANGTLTIDDKRSGQTYSNLLTFEERADIGDGWYHGPAVADQVFTSGACRSDVALVHNGPMLATFRVRTTMGVPSGFEFDRMARSDRFVDLVVDSLVTLRAGCDRVEVETTVQNNAADHRLRVLFPSGARAQTSLSDGAFDVIERPIALRKDNHLYREMEIETRPQQSWTAVFDERRGLAVVSAGLMESCVRDLPERPIALTLFRGTSRTVFTDGEPNGELQGPMTFRYWIVPLSGEPDRTRLCEMGQQLAGGLRNAPLTAADVPALRAAPARPPSGSFLRLEGSAVLTSCRRVGDWIEVRLFNPAARASSASLHAAASRAQLVDFESNILGSAPVSKGVIKLSFKPKQILTLRLS